MMFSGQWRSEWLSMTLRLHWNTEKKLMGDIVSVSYTHLDVYKRQVLVSIRLTVMQWEL